MFPKEIQNIINSYYQSYFMHELNQDFYSNYKWDDRFNRGTWKKNDRLINFCVMTHGINPAAWKKCRTPETVICSFADDKYRKYSLPSRYYTTLIESDLSESERAQMLIKRGVY